MMSPQSVANFLRPGAVEFDLIIFDEASQVKPSDALGAILRGKQVVVVGDSKQLPPTSFFESMIEQNVDEEDDGSVTTQDIESILGLFCSRGAHQRMLRWHYRSRHESLIASSNHLFYDDQLVVFPSPDRCKANVSLVYHHVENAPYDRSRTRTNRVEAKLVAESVMKHAARQMETSRDERLTLGVAAFSVAQRDAILDELELLRRRSPQYEEFFATPVHEQFFVKNLENVQGDERDFIFISVGYGRTAEGYLAMNFGPVSRAGGKRRLNVLFTRARRRCEVFTTLRSDDIDTSRSNSSGASALKSFLHYAEYGNLDIPAATGKPPDSPFEEQVLDALQKRGYTIHTQVGSAGFFIDLAVVDQTLPGRYILGIECDGAAYHSARSARDRDRLRQAVLVSLGWKIHRIWSTAWFQNPGIELQAVIDAIDSATKQRTEYDSPSFDQSSTPPEETPLRDNEGKSPASEDASQAPLTVSLSLKYETASLEIDLGGVELYRVSLVKISDWLSKVIAVEGTIFWLEAARRVANAAGVQKVGGRIQDAFQRACHLGAQSGKFIDREGFLWRTDVTALVVRDRSEFSPQSKKLDFVAPEEICAAIEQSAVDSYGLLPEDVAVAACRLLGFARVSEDMRSVVEEYRDALIKQGRLFLKGETLVSK